VTDLTGEALTRWSIRLALVLYVLAVAALLGLHTPRRRAARLAWTAGCVLYLCHVAFAFHFYHGWSHAAAYEATRAETLRVVGLNWGGGLYFNYALTALWAADVIWWWWVGDRRYIRRHGAVSGTVHGFFALMALNATVVFETGPLRVAGLIGAAVIIACAMRRLRGCKPRDVD
jgi:hypothetical protein